ncbi:MAG: hypothetical protein M3415_08505 [Actinomycetota bacterium]|jgi:hypothetical protein|nr:hypothetical protein [Actinomycetota bacterium]
MTDQQQHADRGRRECARFRDETKLALVGGLAEFADRLRDEWEAPVLLAKLRVLHDDTLDDERRERVVREVTEAAGWTRRRLGWVKAHSRGAILCEAPLVRR